MSVTHEQNTISVIGIPTSDRPHELDRVLGSLIAHIQKFNRDPEIVIADDSSDTNLELNKTTITKYRSRYHGKITHLDYSEREKLAYDIHISCKEEIRLSVINFAILGEGTAATRTLRTGALRNSIFLYAAGTKILFLDDDVIINPHIIPQHHIDLKSQPKAIKQDLVWHTWLFDDYQSAIEYFPQVDIDYIAAHEKLLGNSIQDPSDSSPSYITTTHSGITGHSWMRINPPLLHTFPDPAHNLFGKNEIEYEQRKITPFIARATPHYSFTQTMQCISHNLGVDTTKLIPPFAPMYRSQDSLFGYLLNRHVKNSLRGNIPLLLEHKRNNIHKAYTNPLLIQTCVSKLTINSLRIFDSQEYAIQELGKALSDLCNNKNLFKDSIMSLCAQDIIMTKNFLSQIEKGNTDKPLYWKKDIYNITLELNAILTENLGIPIFWDNPEWNQAPDGGWNDFISYTKKIAATLEEWPTMFKIAQTLRN